MPRHFPYSTDPAISTLHQAVLNLEQRIKICPPTRVESECTSITSIEGGSWTRNTQYNTYGMTGGRPVTTRRCGNVTVDNKGACQKLNSDLVLAKQNLEALERKESYAASDRKNKILNAAAQAKQLADDAAALPKLKRDELACDEYKERTRCRQLRERIAAIEKNQAGSPNSQPTQPNPTNSNSSTNFGSILYYIGGGQSANNSTNRTSTNSNNSTNRTSTNSNNSTNRTSTNSNNSTNRTEAQPATSPKPFTQTNSTATTSRLTPRRTSGRRPGNGRQPLNNTRGKPIVRPARVSSASSG